MLAGLLTRFPCAGEAAMKSRVGRTGSRSSSLIPPRQFPCRRNRPNAFSRVDPKVPLSSISGAPGPSNAWGWSRDSRALQTWLQAIPTAQGSVDPPLQTFPSDGGTSVHRLAAQVVEEVEEITARPARLDCDLQVRNLGGARPGAGLRESAVPRGSVWWGRSVSARNCSGVKIFGGSAGSVPSLVEKGGWRNLPS